VKPIKVEHDKLTRAHAVTPIIEAGRVYLPEKAPWLEAFLDETAAFPNAPFDDTVDSVTQALNYMREPREPGIIAWMRQEVERIEAAGNDTV
jgi:predicted phage terminase large subunit-like protein